jgi:hypothetical protein
VLLLSVKLHLEVCFVCKENKMKYLFMFFSFSFYGQVLHHQMISSQGLSKEMPNGLVIKQTIGQQSVTGNSNDTYVVMQGFQQSLWGKYIATSKKQEIEGIKTVTYPNPFVETVNFQFSEPITDMVSILVFDILGRVVYQQNKIPINTILTINLEMLPSTKYLVRLNTPKLNYYTQIIKK